MLIISLVFFINDVLLFPLISFSFYYLVNFFVEQLCWQQILLVLPPPERVFILPSFLEDIFTRYGSSVLTVLFFDPFKNMPFFL